MAFIEQLIMIQSHLSEHLSLSCITLQGDNCLVGRVCSGWAFPHTIPWQASGHFVYLCSYVLSSLNCREISLVQNPASEKSNWSNMLISCNVTKVATDNFFHIVAYKKNYQKSTWYYALVVDWMEADLNANVVDCKKLDGFNMEDCFCHGIKKKKAIVTFYFTIVTFFSELRDMNSQLREKKSVMILVALTSHNVVMLLSFRSHWLPKYIFFDKVYGQKLFFFFMTFVFSVDIQIACH